MLLIIYSELESRSDAPRPPLMRSCSHINSLSTCAHVHRRHDRGELRSAACCLANVCGPGRSLARPYYISHAADLYTVVLYEHYAPAIGLQSVYKLRLRRSPAKTCRPSPPAASARIGVLGYEPSSPSRRRMRATPKCIVVRSVVWKIETRADRFEEILRQILSRAYLLLRLSRSL
jgi:hypothetical protein